MSYRAEFGQSLYEAFYQEILFLDGTTDEPILGTGIDFQFKVCGPTRDYGDWIEYGQIVASNSNGLIYPTVEPGIIAIKVPPGGFFGLVPTASSGATFSGGCGPTLRCALLAVPTATPADAKTILTGTIKFGAETMIPRLTLKVTPYLPATNTAPLVFANQVKTQLAKIPYQYNLVEASLPGPTDPATITWGNGGPVTLGGPLSNLIASVLGYDASAMTIFLTAAKANPS